MIEDQIVDRAIADLEEAEDKLRLRLIEFGAEIGVKEAVTRYDEYIDRLWTGPQMIYHDEVHDYMLEHFDDYFTGRDLYAGVRKEDLLRNKIIKALGMEENTPNTILLLKALVRYGVEMGPKKAIFEFREDIEMVFGTTEQYLDKVIKDIKENL